MRIVRLLLSVVLLVGIIAGMTGCFEEQTSSDSGTESIISTEESDITEATSNEQEREDSSMESSLDTFSSSESLESSSGESLVQDLDGTETGEESMESLEDPEETETEEPGSSSEESSEESDNFPQESSSNEANSQEESLEVKIPVTAIEVTGEKSIAKGKVIQLSAIVTPSNASDSSVLWSVVSGANVVSVSSSGKVTANSVGEAIVRATAIENSKVYGEIILTVLETQSSSLLSGSGTKDSPYLVSSEKDLQAISKFLSQKGLYFQQTADINLSGEFNPLGTEETPFQNHYNGNGYAINQLSLTDGDYVGLFGYTKNATIENVTLNQAVIQGNITEAAGCLAGCIENTSISDCMASCKIDASGENIGGMIGKIIVDKSGYSVFNCSVAGTVSANTNVGGLIGYAEGYEESMDSETYVSVYRGIKISRCTSNVIVCGEGECIGGLIGRICYGTTVLQCGANGSVEGRSRNAGGLIGEVYYGDVIAECYAHGDVLSSNSSSYGLGKTGGLIGCVRNCRTIHDCYATGKVTSMAIVSDCQDKTTSNGGLWMNYRNPTGALIGYLSVYYYGDYYNNYATGEVVVEHRDKEYDFYHSLIGYVDDSNTVKYNVKEEYKKPSSKVYSSEYDFDLTEEMLIHESNYHFSGNYCLSTANEYGEVGNYLVQKNSNSLVGQYRSTPSFRVTTNITAAELSDQQTFAGWDFGKIWEMRNGVPVLCWEN